MAIGFVYGRSIRATNVGSPWSFTITTPAANSVMVLLLGVNNSGVPTLPTGWLRFQVGSTRDNTRVYFGYKIADGTETSIEITGLNSTMDPTGVYAEYDGVDALNAFGGWLTKQNISTNPIQTDSMPLAPQDGIYLASFFGWRENNLGTVSIDSGFFIDQAGDETSWWITRLASYPTFYPLTEPPTWSITGSFDTDYIDIGMYYLRQPVDNQYFHVADVKIEPTYIDLEVTDFPFLIKLADLPQAFWGVVRDGGGDIRVTTGDGLAQLPREVVSCDKTAKTGELWVKVPVVSATEGAVIRIYCDRVSSEPDPLDLFGRYNVWSDYLGVWHLSETPSTAIGNWKDSTINENHGTSKSEAGAATTLFGIPALDINNRDQQSIEIPDNPEYSFFSTYSWHIVCRENANNGDSVLVKKGSYSDHTFFATAQSSNFRTNFGTPTAKALDSKAFITGIDGVAAATCNTAGSSICYQNGVSVGGPAGTPVITNNNNVIQIGADGSGYEFDGAIRDFRLTDQELSAARVKAEAENIMALDFYTVNAASSGVFHPVVESYSQDDAGSFFETTIQVAAPAGIEVGDLLVLFFFSANTITSIPSGFNVIGDLNEGGDAIQVAWKVADAGDVAQSTYSVSQQTSNRMTASIARVSGVDISNPINNSAVARTSVTSNPTPPTYAIDNEKCVNLRYVAEEGSSIINVSAVSYGTLLHGDDGQGKQSSGLSWDNAVGVGTIPSATFTANTSDAFMAATVSLNPTPATSGLLYVIVQSSATAAPTAEQIRGGLDGTGAAALFFTYKVADTTAANAFDVTGLSALTEYQAYFVWSDTISNSAVYASNTFTTYAGTLTLPTVASITASTATLGCDMERPA